MENKKADIRFFVYMTFFFWVVTLLVGVIEVPNYRYVIRKEMQERNSRHERNVDETLEKSCAQVNKNIKKTSELEKRIDDLEESFKNQKVKNHEHFYSTGLPCIDK